MEGVQRLLICLLADLFRIMLMSDCLRLLNRLR